MRISDWSSDVCSSDLRAVTLTEAGVQYLARVEPVLAALEEADHEARGTGELRGVLRVGATTSFAMREFIQRLPLFMQSPSSLRIDFVIAEYRKDLIKEAADVTMRCGWLHEHSRRAWKMGT